MKIAVIGAGITGLGTAYALAEDHEVHLFEQDRRLGGHAHTVDVRFGDATVPVDTGFIVFNERNYPNLVGLFDHLDVPTKWSDMSFALSVAGGRLEYGCDNYDQLFAQRLNLLRPTYVRGMLEILRFNRTAPGFLTSGALRGVSLGAFLARERYSTWFRDRFILPFGGAIWSTPTARMLEFPAESFVRFFHNHDLMNGMSAMQRWRTVAGGSREYVARLAARLGDRIHAGTGAVAVRRAQGRPVVALSDGSEAGFDQVVFACHGPQAHALLTDGDAQEREILGAFKTSDNMAVLHSDPALMPRRRKIWASWNFLCGGSPAEDVRPAPVTYWMNRLQGIPKETPLFVSLNPTAPIREDLVHGTYSYAHPVFDAQAFAAQDRIGDIQGRGGLWYAGAWLGYGFHEDGLRTGLRVAQALGARPAWARDLPPPADSALAEAAE
ncbi:MAG: FAD-dependent oxidoreductase [Pseudomonadota bacterium]